MGRDDNKTKFGSQLLRLRKKGFKEHAARVSAFLKKEYNVFIHTDTTEWALFDLAIQRESTAMTMNLIDFGLNVNVQDCYGETPLMKILTLHPSQLPKAHNFKFDMVRILLAANANIHLRYEDGTSIWQTLGVVDTPVVHLLMKKLSEERQHDSRSIAKTLIDANCPLAIAVVMGERDVATLVLDHGIPMVDLETLKCALYAALDTLNVDIIKMIFERRLDVHAMNASGQTPMSYFGLTFKNTEEHRAILKLFLDCGAHKFDENEKMAISAILEKGDRQTISLLFRYNLDYRKKDADGRTVLHYLALNSHPEVLEEMHDKDFDVNHSDKQGLSALHFSLGRLEIMEFLIKQGADVDSTGNGLSSTPLIMAYMNIDNRLKKCSFRVVLGSIKLLLQHGADPQVTHKGLSIFEKPPAYYGEQRKMEPIIARLVKLEVLGDKINERIISQIRKHYYLRSCYDLFHHKIVRMKKCLVYKSISLFTLMTCSRRRFAYHMRNRDLVAKFLELQNCTAYKVDDHFCHEVQKRFVEFVEATELRVNVADVIFEISGFHRDRHHIIVDSIIDNLSLEELRKFR